MTPQIYGEFICREEADSFHVGFVEGVKDI
jgi:hypothetical protein